MVAFNLERVAWMDSRCPTDSWARVRDFGSVNALSMVSVGFIIKETDEEILVAPHVGIEDVVEDTQVSGVITIPKVSIVSRETLKTVTVID